MNARAVLAAAGAAAALAGVAVAIEPSLASGIVLQADRGVVLALAALALLQGLAAVAGRVTGSGRAAEPDTVEDRFPATIPGEEFDALLADLPELSVQRRDEERAAIRDRLEALAVAVLVGRGLDEATARRRLEDGTWTADERAATFFMPAADRELSLGRRLRDAFGSDLAFTRRARRTVTAIAAHAEGEVPPPDETGATAPGPGRETPDPSDTAVAHAPAADGGGDGE